MVHIIGSIPIENRDKIIDLEKNRSDAIEEVEKALCATAGKYPSLHEHPAYFSFVKYHVTSALLAGYKMAISDREAAEVDREWDRGMAGDGGPG